MENSSFEMQLGNDKNVIAENKMDKKISTNTVLERIDKKLFLKHLGVLIKDQIDAFIGHGGKKITKIELVKLAIEKVYGNELLMLKFYNEFRYVFALAPTRVEEILGCTTTERKRWAEEDLLKVLEYRRLYKYGKTIEYPVFNVLNIYSITKENVESWREEYEQVKKINKAVGSKKATETRKVNEDMRADFKKEFKKALVSWYKIDGKVGATFELAFWTGWVSRWAKENQIKSYVGGLNKFSEQKEYLYRLKNDAIKLLIKSEYASQSFYRPMEHSKETWWFCDWHFEDWKEERKDIGTSNWSYFEKNKEDIINCPCCNYDSGDDYYSLFYLEIKHEKIKDYKFSFHTPYNIGEGIFKEHSELPTVEHSENEGMFRFGRSLLEEEKIVYREKDVIKKFQEAVEKYKMYFQI